MIIDEIMKDLDSICGGCSLKSECIEDQCLVFRLKMYLIENGNAFPPGGEPSQ